MKTVHKVLLSVLIVTILADVRLLWGDAGGYRHAGENIRYVISPLGESEYNDHGLVDLGGVKANLITFKTKVLLFEDTEKIYSDPDSLLPIKVERVVSTLWLKEHITEEYDQERFTVTIRKFNGDTVINERVVQAKSPVYNAITLPFYMRGVPGLAIGWQYAVRIPDDEFTITLVSVDTITVPAGTFEAYHFESIPDKVEIWVNKQDPRVVLKIQGKGIFGYVLSMQAYVGGRDIGGIPAALEQR